jgi:hypothetical protein
MIVLITQDFLAFVVCVCSSAVVHMLKEVSELVRFQLLQFSEGV